MMTCLHGLIQHSPTYNINTEVYPCRCQIELSVVLKYNVHVISKMTVCSILTYFE